MTQFRSQPEPEKKEESGFRFGAPEKEEPKVEPRPEAKKKAPPAKVKAPKTEEKKEEKPEPPRKTRVTVLRDLVEDLESDSSFSDEQRKAFMELNRRLTRALAR